MADNTTKIVLTAEDRTASALSAVKGNLQGISQSAELATRALGAIGVSFTGAAMVAMVKGTIDAADGFNDLAQRVGISIRELAGWTLAANQSGTSIETVAKGIKGLSVYMVEHGDKLREAGITATDANGAMMELADLFKAMPDPVQRTALAVQLFGKAGMDMLPMLLQGSAGLKDAQEKADAYGKKMAELAPQADEFNDLLAELGLQSKAIGINITEFMLPGLIGMAKWLNDIASGGVKAQQALAWMIGDRNVATLVMMGHPGLTGGAPREVSGKIGGQGPAALTLAEEEALAQRNLAGLRGAGLLNKSTAGGGAVRAPKAPALMDSHVAAFDASEAALERRRIAMEDMAETRMQTARIESEGEEAIRLSLEKTNAELAKQKDMATDLGMTFSSAFEDAIVGGRGLQSIMQGLAQDVARIFVRNTVTQPLGNFLSDFFKDAMPKFASGGDHMGGLRLVGENGPEIEATGPARIFSASQTRDIIGGSGGGSPQSVRVEVVNPPGRPAEVASATPRMDVDGMVIKVVLRDLASGGAISNAMAGQFGLNRAAGAY